MIVMSSYIEFTKLIEVWECGNNLSDTNPQIGQMYLEKKTKANGKDLCPW